MQVPETLSGFNPRTHTGCDGAIVQKYFTNWVSIHAPTRGATAMCLIQNFSYTVSIHAPTRGATSFREIVIRMDVVSIHAPTRGATKRVRSNSAGKVFQSTHPHGVRLSVFRLDSGQKRFNPRTHTGCDGCQHSKCDSHVWFQSTHPHGVRLKD